MSHNTFGHLFRVTTFGESHGRAIGCVVDGCPPLIPLEEAEIQVFLDQRKPGQSRFTTQRRESDTVLAEQRRLVHGRPLIQSCCDAAAAPDTARDQSFAATAMSGASGCFMPTMW